MASLCVDEERSDGYFVWQTWQSLQDILTSILISDAVPPGLINSGTFLFLPCSSFPMRMDSAYPQKKFGK